MGNNTQRARNVGSSYSTFRYRGLPIAYLVSVQDQGQSAPVQPEAIHPLGEKYAVEIVTPRYLGTGTLTLTITELWHQEIWEQLAGLSGTRDIVEIFNRLAAEPDYVTCTKIITPDDGKKYGKVYHQVVISGVQTGDSLSIDTLTVNKQITALYTHTTDL